MESNALKRKVNRKYLYVLYTQFFNDLNDSNSQLKLCKGFIEELKANVLKYPIDTNIEEGLSKELEEYQLEEINYEYNAKNNILLFKGYPKNNLLLLLAHNILICIVNRRFVFSFNELKGYNQDQTTDVVETLDKTLFRKGSEQEDIQTSELLRMISERDILTLLGLRKTPGSLSDHLPPDVFLLREMFNEMNQSANQSNSKPNPQIKPSILTVGAKALSKHSHRSQTESFWPSSSGEEKVKNDKAHALLEMFLKECVWINIHGLPHEIAIIELRIAQGYGIRWQIDGKFRGFLEPPMENGHQKKWLH